MSPRAGGRVAALDLGSNSFHLLVADVVAGGRSGGHIQQVATSKITLRLAEPVSRTGELGSQARKRAAEAFAELVGEARAAGAQRVVAVATEAIRGAADSERFRSKVEAEPRAQNQVLTPATKLKPPVSSPRAREKRAVSPNCRSHDTPI